MIWQDWNLKFGPNYDMDVNNLEKKIKKNWEGEAESNFGITSNCMALDCIALDAMALHGVTMVTTTNEQTSEYRATQLINT